MSEETLSIGGEFERQSMVMVFLAFGLVALRQFIDISGASLNRLVICGTWLIR